MTYTKDYLTKREAFKAYIVTLPVETRKKWIEVLKVREQYFGAYFNPYGEKYFSGACCVVGALRVADPECEWCKLVTEHLAHRLNDKYRVPFPRFIKWIRESLKQPVK